MTDPSGDQPHREPIVVTYWASARAAVGLASEEIGPGPLTLAELLAELRRRHPDEAVGRVLGVCSVLIGDQPVGTRDPATVVVGAGERVELLPPFAGG